MTSLKTSLQHLLHEDNRIDTVKKAKPLSILKSILLQKHEVIITYPDQERSKVIDLIVQVRKQTEMLLDTNEACQIYMTAKRTQKIKGDIAEVGVYKGGSAKLICEAKGERPLFLFDTFEGLPNPDSRYDDLFKQGEFASNLESVKKLLQKYPNVQFFKGLFPSTAEPIKDKLFSFVNLDVDIYSSTKDCLEFFYPRMSRCGAILSHDYSSTIGVKKAFNEFFENKPEAILDLSGTQCMIVKV